MADCNLAPTSKDSVKPTVLPPCKVCGGQASGFHYGVNTCEACKTFFRRSLLPENRIKPCKKDGRCVERSQKGKISCGSCRHQQCLAVGMTKEGCKKGRYTYEKRLSNMKEVILANAASADKNASAEVTSSEVTSSAPESTGVEKPITSAINTDKELELLKLADSLEQDFLTCFQDICKFTKMYSMHAERIRNHLKEREWDDVRNYTFIPGSKTDQSPYKDFSLIKTVSEHIPSLRLPKDQQKPDADRALHVMWLTISRSIEQDVLPFSHFVKRLPGYNELPMDDKLIMFKSVLVEQLSLTKANTYQYEINAHVFFDQNTEDLHLFPLDVMKIVFAGGEYHTVNERCRSRVLKLDPTIKEMALLTAILVFSSDRMGLKSSERIEELQHKLIEALQLTIERRCPDQAKLRFANCLMILPDLRECGQVHAERAISKIGEFEMGEKISSIVLSILQMHPF